MREEIVWILSLASDRGVLVESICAHTSEDLNVACVRHKGASLCSAGLLQVPLALGLKLGTTGTPRNQKGRVPKRGGQGVNLALAPPFPRPGANCVQGPMNWLAVERRKKPSRLKRQICLPLHQQDHLG